MNATFSIVIETENLALGGVADLERCLDSLAAQSVDIRTANEVWMMVGGHLDSASAAAIAGRYPWVKVHAANDELSYLAAKRQGARLSSSAYVLFADSDVAYAPEWIELLLAEVAKHPKGTVVCSDTRVPLDSGYGFAMQVAWMLPVLRSGGPIQPTKAFRLNNFVIDRETMANSEFDEGLPLYRGTFGYWRKRMRGNGATFYRVPRTMAYHLAPQGLQEWWYRMLVFGADYVATGDYRLHVDGRLEARPSPLRRLWYAVKWIGYRWTLTIRHTVRLLAEQPWTARFLPSGIPIMLASLVIQTFGSLVTVFHSRLVYDRLVAFENSD